MFFNTVMWRCAGGREPPQVHLPASRRTGISLCPCSVRDAYLRHVKQCRLQVLQMSAPAQLRASTPYMQHFRSFRFEHPGTPLTCKGHC